MKRISDNLALSGRIIYAVMLITSNNLSPWDMEEIIKPALALSQGEAQSYAGDIYSDAEKELAGRIVFALKDIAPDIELGDDVNSKIRGALAVNIGRAEAYARALDNYIDLKSYIIKEQLDFIEREAMKNELSRI